MADSADVDQLASEVEGASEPTVAHPFDGMVLAQTIIPLALTVVPVIRKWIDARRDARKEYRIIAGGIDISGYTAREAAKVLESLAKPEDAQVADDAKPELSQDQACHGD